MRAWTLRHPNVMVVYWVLVAAWFGFWATERLANDRWGWAAVNAVAGVWAMSRVEHWWRRT